ncbi:hypothetical protein F4860DRAFT_529130 [Xylaria cubensis]|nr:hypothetical protein F4860DRAFT_529130 [Xylaria cubensis]
MASLSKPGAETTGPYMALLIPEGPEYQPTRDVPIVTPVMKALLAAVDHGTTMDLSNIVMKVAEIEHRSGRRSKHMEAFLKASEVCYTLISSMPRNVIKAVVLGVVATASDCLCPPHHPLHIKMDTYACDGPGTYVANIAVRGRHGRGYTRHELQKIIETMKSYVMASSELSNNGQSITEPVELAEIAYAIDNVYGTATRGKLAFIQNDNQRRNIEALIATLVLLANGAGSRTGIAQLPAYYGCSSNSVVARGLFHRPKQHWKQGVGNYTHWLLMSIMKMQGLEPDVRVTPVIRTWFDGALSASEIIGTILGMGGSHVTQKGLNVMWPGSQDDDATRDFDKDRAATFQSRSYLKENKAESDKVESARLEMRKYLNNSPIVTLQDAFQSQLQILEDKVAETNDTFRAFQQTVKNNHEEIRKAFEATEREVKFASEIKALASEMSQLLTEEMDVDEQY